MELQRLIAGLDVRTLRGDVAGVRICDLTEDSRTVVPGSLFVARRGGKSDGNGFTAQAVAAGAVAVLTDDANAAIDDDVVVLYAADVAGTSAQIAERFYGEPSRTLGIAAVTGTNGKTTTACLIWSMLNHADRRCGLVGTVIIDDGVEVAPAAMTTPPAIEMSRTLGVMVESGCVAAAIEASSHALHQKRVEALRIRVGIFTNLTGDHLDYHKTMDGYAAAKRHLFELLEPAGVAVTNADDPWSVSMVAPARGTVVRCTAQRKPDAEASVEVTGATLEGMDLALRGPFGMIETRIALLGRYNAMNALQAAVAGHALGLTPPQIAAGLAAAKSPPGRMERVSTSEDRCTVFVDFAHTDDALQNAIGAVVEAMPNRAHAGAGVVSAAGAAASGKAPGRLWVVFGCGGDKDRTKRPRMGKVAADMADIVIVTSDNPRTERPSAIIDEILAGVPGAVRQKVRVQVDRERAIRMAITEAAQGDVIIIAGKGHETEQILPDGKGGVITTHFDDREIARAVLAEQRPRPAVVAATARTAGAAGRPAERWGR